MSDLRYFSYEHLSGGLRTVSSVMYHTARLIDTFLPEGPEKSAGMRKLLEAKDCFVRAALDGLNPQKPAENKFPVPCTRNLVGLPCECGQCTHTRNVARNAT